MLYIDEHSFQDFHYASLATVNYTQSTSILAPGSGLAYKAVINRARPTRTASKSRLYADSVPWAPIQEGARETDPRKP